MKKRIFTAVLAALILLLPLLYGCGGGVSEGVRVVQRYLSAIASGDYAAAYNCLSTNVRYTEAMRLSDEAEGKEQRADTISEEQFVSRYTNIFDALGIEEVTWEITNAVEGSIVCIVDYDVTYRSSFAGDIARSFHVEINVQGGAWTIDWSPALIFPEMTWGDTVATATLSAARGEILADGVAVAKNVDKCTVYAAPSKIEDEEAFCHSVAAILGMKLQDVREALKKAYNDFAALKQGYPDMLTDEQKEALLAIPGAGISNSGYGTLRYYPEGDLLAHTVGYVGRITAEELVELTGSKTGNALYNADSFIGKTGLEKQFEKELRGVDGRMIFIRSADGVRKSTLYTLPAQNGYDVRLTIDFDLQKRTEEVLKLVLYSENTAGAVVVMNPKTGAVDAIASYPSYDLNLFVNGISAADWKKLSTQANAPLFNRLTQGRYPPGSIFKPFTAAAVLESGAMKASDVFPKNEHIEDNRWVPSADGEFGPWAYSYITRVKINNRHSPLNMHNAIIDSDNIYFAYATLKAGEETFETYMTRYGFDRAIPFDLPVASAQIKNKDTAWNPQLLADSGYGQGEVLVTPLHAAAALCLFANGGDIYAPRVVEGLYTDDGNDYRSVSVSEPTIWLENLVPDSVLNEIEPMLEDVIKDGTGHSVRVRTYSLAGKTGTAEVGGNKARQISWFGAYRINVSPDEERFVLVMLEVPTTSEYSSMKFTIARELLK